MMKVKNLLSGMLAVLAVLLLTGCQWNENPVRTSLDILQTDLTLQVGESATRAASTESKDYEFIYTSSNPAVAIVDQSGKVTAMSEGTATITVTMPETKIGWYAAATRQYKVIVNKVSAKALENVDKSTPLTLVAAEDGKITVTFNNGVTLKNDIHYTINGGAEQTIAKNTSGAYDITVKKGDVVQLYSINTSLGGGAVAGARGTTRAVDTGAKYINIRPSMKTEIYGNVMSLLKGKDNLESATTIEANNAFYGLFAGAEKLVNNTERLLVLPATTLTEGCYQDMFNGCKGIEKAPELPAPKLEKNCYQEMFYDCAKLNSVTCLATDITAEGSTKDWLGKAGTEASAPVLETKVDMKANSDDGVPTSWTPKKIVLVESVTLNKQEMSLNVGESETLKATVKPDGASDQTVTWTSSKPAVATVDATGKVTAVAAGEATITAQAGDKSASCTVSVADVYAANEYKEGSWDITEKKLVFTKKTLDSDYATVTNTTASWSGWLMVSGNVTIDGNVMLAGNTNLILQDGATLTINGTINCNNNLIIYGQGKGDGKLNVTKNDGTAIDGNPQNIDIHGGEITVTAGNASVGIFVMSSEIRVLGGKLTVEAESTGISCSNMSVFGGEVDATSTSTSSGISCSSSLIVYGGKVKGTGARSEDKGIRGKVQSGTSGIKFYFSSNGTDWDGGRSYEESTNLLVIEDAKRYIKAE